MNRILSLSRFALALALAVFVPACGGGSGGGGPVDASADVPLPAPSPIVPPVSLPEPEPEPEPEGAPSTGTALASPSSFASVTEGVAPLGVVFHAVGTTVNGSGASVAGPADGDYASFHYAWDYGDPASGIWPTSHRGRNSDTGYVGAHVYERPGTYTCALTVMDAAGTSRTYAQRIVVNAFAGQTYYVSEQGDDAASGLSEATPWRTVANVRANLGPNRRFLFRRGGAFDLDAPLEIVQPGPGLIGAYGPSASPRPVLRSRRSGITLFSDDWRFTDLELRGPSTDALGICLTSEGGVDRALFQRVALRNFEVGLVMSNIERVPPHDGIVVADCESTNAHVNGFFVGARRLALLGNTVSDVRTSHATRVWQANRSLIAHNVFVRPGGDRHSLKLHGPKPSDGTPFTEYVVVANNRFQGNLLTVIVAPQNAISDEPISHVLIERNRTESVPMTQADYVIEARDVTIRNNVMDGTRSPRFTGVAVQAGGVVRAPTRIRVESNTMYKGSSGVEAHMAVVEAGASDVRLRNNFGAFPAVAANAKGVVQGACPGLAVENNLLTDVPGFANAGGGDFHPLSSSPALGRGLPSIFVRDDYNEMPRSGSAPALGAYER